MAEGKKSFVLYTEIIHTVRKLSNEKAGELFKHILSYVNDEHPVTDDILIEVAFEPIKQALKKDLQKWQEYQEKQRLNGAKGGRPRKQEETQKTQPFQENPTQPKKAVNVNVNDNVNVNERENIAPSPEQQNIDHLVPIEKLEEILIDDYIWIESLARLYKFDSTAENSMQIAREWVKKWVENQRAENVKLKSKEDAFKHCKRWINIQVEKYGKTTAKDFNGNGRTGKDTGNTENLAAKRPISSAI